MMLSVQFSVRISKLTDQVKNLVQENALLREKIEEIIRARNLQLTTEPINSSK
jgi:hypothetical protein